MDEIEKALAGAADGGHDSGVSAGLLGTLLTWLNDHETDVFFVGTSNDVSKLPPEFTRAERFDALFFMDLPDRTQKIKIWGIYREYFELEDTDELPNDELWTGAEIRSCCRLAKLLDVPLKRAAIQVVPVAVTSKERVGKLKDWANKRCLSADYEGVYDKAAREKKTQGTTRPRRRVNKDKDKDD